MSCDTGKRLNNSEDIYEESLLNGTWVIEKEVCCGRSQIVTFGGTKEMTFRVKTKSYTVREQGRVKEQGTYRIDKKSQFGPVIYLGENTFPAMYQVENGQLLLNWGYMDLQEETYRRK